MYICTANVKDMKDNTYLLLLRMRWIQQRRDFSWRSVFVAAYFTFLYLALVGGLYVGLREESETMTLPFEGGVLPLIIAVAIIPGDLFIKLIWRRSPVEMDDVLRSRPVGKQAWALLILTEAATSFTQWLLPLATAVVILLFFSWPLGLSTLVVSFTATMVNAMFQNCWRRAPGNEYTLPLVAGYIAWLVLAYAIVIATFVIVALVGDDASEPSNASAIWGTVIGTAALMLFNVTVITVLHRYFCRMKNYNENATHIVRHTSKGTVDIRRMEWTAIWRSKRLRTSLLVIAPLFLLNTYLQQMPDTISTLGFNSMLILGVAFPSVIIAQYGLGIEANFIHGIWSKPWMLEGILLNKFRMYSMLCVAMAVCCLPAVIWMGMSIFTLLAVLLFSIGFFMPLMMPMSLFCSRIDLFASAFFNYQGANKQMNIYSFILFVPIIIYFATMFLLPTLVADAIMAALGLVGLAMHRPIIHWIAERWRRQRYTLMERWTKE